MIYTAEQEMHYRQLIHQVRNGYMAAKDDIPPGLRPRRLCDLVNKLALELKAR